MAAFLFTPNIKNIKSGRSSREQPLFLYLCGNIFDGETVGAYLVFEHLRSEIVAAHRFIADPYLDDIAAILAAGAVV